MTTSAPVLWATGVSRSAAGSACPSSPPNPGFARRCWAWAGAPASAEDAARITVPVEFLVQWDDERVPRERGSALFDAFASAEKTLRADPGAQGEIPAHETDSTLRFSDRHLG